MRLDFTEIFCLVDDLFIEIDKNFLSINNCKKKTGPKNKLNKSEILTIIIGYWRSSNDCFKSYYLNQVCTYHNKDFRLVSYSQFVKLMKSYLPFLIMLLNSLLDKCDGISFVDSTSMSVCKNNRIYRHKVFDGFAKRGKTTKG